MTTPLRPTVLLVDDDEDTREALADALRDAGFEVDTAGDGGDALRDLRHRPPPTAMLIDLEMPDMDGVELCAACQADPRLSGIPRIIVSGAVGMPRFQERVSQCRAVAALSKPTDVPALLSLLRAVAIQAR